MRFLFQLSSFIAFIHVCFAQQALKAYPVVLSEFVVHYCFLDRC